MQGFKGAAGKVESRPARHLRSALGQIVNFFYTLQGEAAGAQAFSHFDTLLAPFIRFDSLGFDEVKQALQEFVFNINVPTRVGFQTPFHQYHDGLEVPSLYRDKPVIIGGEFLDVDLRRVPGGDARVQPCLPRGTRGGRRQGTRVHVPHPHIQHHEGLRLG